MNTKKIYQQHITFHANCKDITTQFKIELKRILKLYEDTSDFKMFTKSEINKMIDDEFNDFVRLINLELQDLMEEIKKESADD